MLRSDKIRKFFLQSTWVQNPLSPRLLNDVKTRQTIINKNMLLCTEVEIEVFTRREKNEMRSWSIFGPQQMEAVENYT